MSHVLDLELSTLYVLDAHGRLERERRESFFPPPLVAVACGKDGITWACGSAVPAPIVAEVEGVLRDEPAIGEVPRVGWAPVAADAILAYLPEVGPVEVDVGPSYVAPVEGRPSPAPTIELRTSADTDLADLANLLPERDRRLDPPWVVAIVEGAAAAVCETARSAPHAVEAGVWTYERHRRRGLASLVTATWIDLVRPERTAFYSTSADNLGSQGVARRLGLTPLAQWWQVRAVAAAAVDR